MRPQHRPYSESSCELALRAVGLAGGLTIGGAPHAFMRGIRA